MPSRALSQRALELQLDRHLNEDYSTLPRSKWDDILNQVRDYIKLNSRRHTRFAFRGVRDDLDQIIPYMNTLIDEMQGDGFRIVDVRNSFTEIPDLEPIFDLSSSSGEKFHLVYTLSYR